MILTGRVGMEGPSDEEEEEGTEIVGRSREPEEAKVLSMRTGGASDLKKKKGKARTVGTQVPLSQACDAEGKLLFYRGSTKTTTEITCSSRLSKFQINKFIRIF